MIDLDKALKFLEHFSLVTVANNKVPNFSWKKNQSEKLSSNEFTERYTYKGGKEWVDKDGVIHEIKPTENFGIICGFDDLEVIDIDLKVFSTAKEQVDFWA